MLRAPYDTRSAPRFVRELAAGRDRVALTWDGGSLTYEALASRVASLATELGPGRRLVAVTAANEPDALVAYLAALYGGHVVVLTTEHQVAGEQSLLTRYDPDVVLDAATGWSPSHRHDDPAHDLHPELTLLLSTSGTTGSPRLVRLAGSSLDANAEAIASYLQLTASDRAITTLPMQYCYGLSVIHSHLRVGAALTLTTRSVVDPALWELARATGVTSFAGVPHTFDLLDHSGHGPLGHPGTLPSLRYVTQAGGRLCPERVRRYATLGQDAGWDFVVMYGQTEATARMAYLPPELAARRPEAIGVPIPGGSFTIEPLDGGADSEAATGGAPAIATVAEGGVAEGEVGELVYRGPNVMLGYAECPADLARGRTVEALRTGDLARRAPDGLYEIVGRANRFVKPFGLRVSLDDVEARLRARGIDALCTGNDERLVIGAVSPPVGLGATVAADLRLPPSVVQVVPLDEVPRAANGKPDYPALQARVGELAGASATDADTGRRAECTVARVRAAFHTALGVEAGDDDTFVGLGGDSLSYVQLTVELEDLLGELPADWQRLTVAELAARRGRRRRHVARVETGVVLRAAAIVVVVTTHTELLYLPGGAHALFALAGFNYARFQRRAPRRLPGIVRLAVPCALWIGLLAVVTEKFRWPHALFVNAQFGTRDASWAYWFVESLLQVLVVVGVVLAVPGLRRLERRAPFGFAVGLLAVGLGVRFAELGPRYLQNHRASHLFWLFVLGWVVALAETHRRRIVVTALVLATVPTFFVSPERDVVVTGAVLALLWLPTVPVPRCTTRTVGLLADASLAIYLTHWQLYPVLLRLGGPLLSTLGCIAAGIAVALLAERVCRRVRRLTGHGRRSPHLPDEVGHSAPVGSLRS